MALRDDGAAKSFADDYIALNPKDILGVRQKTIELALTLGDYDEALKLIEQAHDPQSAYNLFGKALTLFSHGKHDKAEHALQIAIESRPRIYREMTADKHRMPHNYNPSYVNYFSPEEAYNYHATWAPVWLKKMGALNWLRKEGKKYLAKG